MAVGASFGARLEHLRARKGTKETELAKVFGINRSTIGRILKGETEKVSSQLVIDTVQYFGVSTDFLLGLTDMPDPMNHPMEEFKLTEGAAKAILYEDVHIEMLNRLLENGKSIREKTPGGVARSYPDRAARAGKHICELPLRLCNE